VPEHRSLDFNDGLPPGWETGQLVFDDLPEGSRAAVRTAAVEENGQRRYTQHGFSKFNDSGE
jgi:hypothetical protein